MWLKVDQYLDKINNDSVKYFEFNDRILKIQKDIIPLDFTNIFQNEAPVKLEIGFGNGESLIDLAKRQPQYNFFGIDRKMDRVRTALKKLNNTDRISNLIIARLGAEYIQEIIRPASCAEIIMNFPDPWPKKRQNKNRTINTEFIKTIHSLLSAQGIFRYASDHKEYSLEVSKLFKNSSMFINSYPVLYKHKVDNRVKTQFEKHKIKEGKQIFYIKYKKLD